MNQSATNQRITIWTVTCNLCWKILLSENLREGLIREIFLSILLHVVFSSNIFLIFILKNLVSISFKTGQALTVLSSQTLDTSQKAWEAFWPHTLISSSISPLFIVFSLSGSWNFAFRSALDQREDYKPETVILESFKVFPAKLSLYLPNNCLTKIDTQTSITVIPFTTWMTVLWISKQKLLDYYSTIGKWTKEQCVLGFNSVHHFYQWSAYRSRVHPLQVHWWF